MHNQPMDAAARLDLEAIARACKHYCVERLRVFVSALTDAFDTEGSDIDFLVDFVAGKTTCSTTTST